uniref:CCHC-type domain-containing protein n=2 Tax=Populus TaxID=3689 RepID=A0A4U5R391_POPAL|nr:hypothetical protein D5086_0000006170 [Populus alba]
MGLNDTYSAIRGQILLMNPLPSIRQAYSSVCQEEKQRFLSVAQTEMGGSTAMAVRYNNQGKRNFISETDRPQHSVNRLSQPRDTRPQGERRFDQDRRRFGSGRGRPQCTHCGEMGHWVQKCFQLNGYPPRHPKARMNGYPIGNQSTIGNQHSIGNQHNGFPLANQVSEMSHKDEDLATRRTIGLGKQRNGLYYLVALATKKNLTKPSSTTNHPACYLTLSSTDLWHNRLGHVSPSPPPHDPFEPQFRPSPETLTSAQTPDPLHHHLQPSPSPLIQTESTPSPANDLSSTQTSPNPIPQSSSPPLEPIPLRSLISPEPDPTHTSPVPTTSPPAAPRRSSRQIVPPIKLADYFCSAAYSDQSTSHVPAPIKGTRYPLSNFVSYHRYNPAYHSFVAKIETVTEPKSYSEAARQQTTPSPIVVDAKHSSRSSKKVAATETTTIPVAAAPRETAVWIQDCNKPFSSSCKAGCNRLPFHRRWLVETVEEVPCKDWCPRSCDSNYLPARDDDKRVIQRGIDLMRGGLEGSALDLVTCGGMHNLSEVAVKNNLCGLSGLKVSENIKLRMAAFFVTLSTLISTILLDSDQRLKALEKEMENLLHQMNRMNHELELDDRDEKLPAKQVQSGRERHSLK